MHSRRVYNSLFYVRVTILRKESMRAYKIRVHSSFMLLLLLQRLPVDYNSV